MQVKEVERTVSEMLPLPERHETVCFEHCLIFGKVLCCGLGKLGTGVFYWPTYFSGIFLSFSRSGKSVACMVFLFFWGGTCMGVCNKLKNHYIS